MADAGTEAPPRVSPLQRAIDACEADAKPAVRVLAVLALLSTPILLAWTYSRFGHYLFAVPTRNMGIAVDLTTVGLFLAVLYYCIHHASLLVATAQGHRAEEALVSPALRAAIDCHGRAGGEASQALSDIRDIEQYLTSRLPQLARDLVQLPAVFIAMCVASWSIAILILLLSTIQFVTTKITLRAAKPDLDAANEAGANSLLSAGTAVNAGEAVEAMGMLPRIAMRWADGLVGGSSRLERAYHRLRVAQSMNHVITAVCGMLPFTALTAFGIVGIHLGQAFLILILMSTFLQSFAQIDHVLGQLQEGKAAVDRMRKLAAAPSLADKSGFACPHGRLSIRGLMIAFPGQSRPTLRNLSLNVEPGEVVGVAGPVGCGKSTLLRAIMGIHVPNAGACYLDGHATWQWERTDFARHVGYLPQEVGVADATVAETIARLGVPDMTMVIEAARRAGAHEIIVGLEQGYATRLTEQGLSAGQRQRVALARAIYGRPKLVVLDEPSAWLDEAGVEDLRRLLAILKADGTSVLFTSHDLRLMDSADQVFALGAVPGKRPAIAAAAA